MNATTWSVSDRASNLEIVWEDRERVFCRKHPYADVDTQNCLVVLPTAERPTPAALKRLSNEYELRDVLDSAWALRPLELLREGSRTMLVLEFPGGERLDRLIGPFMNIDLFLRLAVALSSALGHLHAHGVIHKDIKPANVVVDPTKAQAWLTGFGIASRLPRERQSPDPPEYIAGTLAYMAPEQTGRMNRSIDSRTDLYSLGITLYEMLTGELPFNASDPMDWIHCHIARQPTPPNDVPAAISAIVLKLLAKTAEERYQTAAGVESDLRRCLAEWETSGRIDDFRPGGDDTPDRLMIPEKLYGRDREINVLLTAFDRIVAGGSPELVLVSGYSGIGKSALVNELHKSLVPPRGLFASGKFDQYKRDIPYATLAQAFQSLIRPLLSKSEAELSKWRDALSDALGPNGQLIVDLVPELKHIVGEQQPVPELPPQDAQGRFQLVFGRFIGVFARPEHPLAIFLDDLQWLDAATLDLLEDLLTRSDMRHLLLIGAYRDNEVNPAHPLMRKLETIRQTGALLRDVVLAPLARDDLGQLLVDALHCQAALAEPLAQLIHEKTSGNPFFAIQFLSTLADEALLSFDYNGARWFWDLNRIHAKGYTENVVDLMVGKLHRLPVGTQKALQELACTGNSAEFELLRMIYEGSDENMHAQLWEAVRAGLIFRSEVSYTFLHDRVQEAAYSLIPREQRASAHLRIGTLLATHTPLHKQEEAIFEIVNQLNRGSHLITSVKERERVAGLNLIAGKRAKASTAYASALKYLEAGRLMLTEESWDQNYEIIFSVEYFIAECELLTADLVAADSRLSMLSQRAKSRHDFATVTRLRLTLYTTLDQSDRGVDVFLDYLGREGTHWSAHPTRDEVQREYDRIWSWIGSRQIEDLIDLPLMTNPGVLDALNVLTEIVTPALFIDENLSSLVICRMLNLSLEYGNGDGSCFAYVWFAIIAGPRFGNYKDGFRIGQLGYELVEKRGLTRYQARTYMSFGNIVMPWAKHALEGRDLVRRAFDAAYRAGDLTFAAYSWDELITNLLMAGDPLEEVQLETENGLAFAERARFGLVVDLVKAQAGLVRTLRGLTRRFGCFDDGVFNEVDFERHLADNPALALGEFFYWARKIQGRFFAGDWASAVEASVRAQQLLWTSPSQLETAEFRFYGALSHAASWNSATPDQRPQHFDALKAHHSQLDVWSRHCPENFRNRVALVGAEIARIEGRLVDAEQLYEEAIRSAHTNGFVHNEAVANEVAARFYAARGLEKIAQVYLQDARYCYATWGADAKVLQLDRLYPRLQREDLTAGPTSTIGAPVEQLDLATVIKISQSVAGEIVLEKLIDALMRAAIEYAGAERGLLVLAQNDDYRIEAEAVTISDTVAVNLRHLNITSADMPESVFHYVLRTKESVLLHDASGSHPFSADEYITRHRGRSVLCLPLLRQAGLLGMLYLENNLTSHVFTSGRIAVLKLLAAEAAISLENTRLYRSLQEREAKAWQLVNTALDAVLSIDEVGRITEWNAQAESMFGWRRDEAMNGSAAEMLIPTQYRLAYIEALRRFVTSGDWPFPNQRVEITAVRRDGSEFPVELSVAPYRIGGAWAVSAFVRDITEQKRAEAASHRYREVELELAHANRVATVGHLSASIAHEVTQPIAAAATNAQAAIRWLAAAPPDLDEVRQALRRIISNSNRAGDVIGRIRAFIRKAPPLKDGLDINGAVDEVIALTLSEATKNGISVKTDFTEHLPLVQGDRVQLQQVILNLIINAVEAMSGHRKGLRELKISTSQTGSKSVSVAVRDSGPGLAPASLERIFAAFYTTKPGGLGMGLSICRSIIEAHEGQLWAATDEPCGTTFTFTLPAQASAAA